MPATSPADRPQPSHPVDRARLVAGVICAVQAVFLLGFCAFSLYELAREGSDSPVRVVMEVVLIAVFAAGLLALATYWVRGANWPNTPTIVWNLLLLPVAWGLVQGDRGLIAMAVAGVAVVGIVSAVAADTSPTSPSDR